MDQSPGHHAVTRDAVHALFSHDVGVVDGQGLIRGMNETEYFDRIDHGQAFQDRLWDHEKHELGPTTHSWSADPEVQKDHSLADAHKSGMANLEADRDNVAQKMIDSRQAGNPDSGMQILGAAIHALQDSYSSAHMWRSDSVYAGDHKAPIQSINLFDASGLKPFSPGLPFTEGTHDPRFDKVSVDVNGHVVSGSAVAASKATLEALIVYEHDIRQHTDSVTADANIHKTIDSLYQPSDEVKVNDSYLNLSWLHERDHRLDLEKSSINNVQVTPDDVKTIHLSVQLELSHAPAAAGHGQISTPADANVSNPDGTQSKVDVFAPEHGHGHVSTPADANVNHSPGLDGHGDSPGHGATDLAHTG